MRKPKFYSKEDLKKYNYVVISYDWEDFQYYMESAHKDEEMAKKRCEYLKRQEEIFFNKPQGYAIDYYVVNINDERVKKCFNYEFE